jgi:ABC-type bacteriocin/lantibiotic exporter with double-glycine peptidase domain
MEEEKKTTMENMLHNMMAPDNVVYQIFKKYFWEERWSLGIIVFISFAVNYLQSNLISQVSASIIDSVEHSDFVNVYSSFFTYVVISLVFLVFYFVGELIEMRMLTKLQQWMRQEFLKFIFYSNNESFETTNAIKYSSPINRVSFSAYSMISMIINQVLTNTVFILVITGYFLLKNTTLGFSFLASNVALAFYISYIFDPLMKKKNEYEDTANDNEAQVIDMLNNFDKIIYRGRAHEEITDYKDRANKSIHTANDFFVSMHHHSMGMYVWIYGTILASLFYLIILTQENKIDKKTFIAFMTILLIYRDKLTSIVQLIPNFMEFLGRMDFAVQRLADLSGDYLRMEENNYDTAMQGSLTFDKIEFRGIYYKFKHVKTDDYLFRDFSVTIDAKHSIVGVTGLSGRGKSTLMKLLLKMHSCEKGEIMIDGKDIADIDPTFLRKNIVYVNQSSKLFDKKIIENMLYGCSDANVCQKYLSIIMSYPKIAGLYKKLDIENGQAGPLGEKLSGGQRQIANIISGLVHPSPILILDEPTNALDQELKMELLKIIDDFRVHKKCIIIITHDRDVFPLLDEKIEL